MLRLFYKEEELSVISATRSLKSITRVAENVEVVTAEDIELMNAHTLADVLNAVNGVQIEITGGPGTIAVPHIQGSDFRHVTFFIDGIPLNNLSDNVTDVGPLPVQNIEKIEIIKGPASSVWGSSLGGIVNIITKSPVTGDKLKGTLSASYGKENTGDFGAEAYGQKNNFGYYLSAGRLQSDGLTKGFDFSGNNLYTKLTYNVTNNTYILFTGSYNKGSRGGEQNQEYDFSLSDKFKQLLASLSLNTSLSKELDVNLSLRTSEQIFKYYMHQLSTGSELSEIIVKNMLYGASAKLTWKHERHNIVVGADYDKGDVNTNAFINGGHGLTKWAFFANDTIIWDKLSITPGIRYDNTDTNGDFTSPSLGITYNLSDNTILRAYVARGFSIPSLSATFGETEWYKPNPDLKVEKIWSYQLGAETGALKYLWLKISAFRHEIRDVIVDEILSEEPPLFTQINKEKQRRQGIEIEMKTIPVYNITLSASAAFIHTKDLITGETVSNVPQSTYDISLKYDDEKSFRALLKGHYIWWNTEPLYSGKYNSFIFDLNMIKGLYKQNGRILEAFLTAHNIFNGSQYNGDTYKNPKRWVEGGLRYKF